MSKQKTDEYLGLFYRLRETGKFINKIPLYINDRSLDALEVCCEKLQKQYNHLVRIITLRNIHDWQLINRRIDEAIERDANKSTKYIIYGERIEKEDDKGNKVYNYEDEIKILP